MKALQRHPDDSQMASDESPQLSDGFLVHGVISLRRQLTDWAENHPAIHCVICWVLIFVPLKKVCLVRHLVAMQACQSASGWLLV